MSALPESPTLCTCHLVSSRRQPWKAVTPLFASMAAVALARAGCSTDIYLRFHRRLVSPQRVGGCPQVTSPTWPWIEQPCLCPLWEEPSGDIRGLEISWRAARGQLKSNVYFHLAPVCYPLRTHPGIFLPASSYALLPLCHHILHTQQKLPLGLLIFFGP